MKHSKYILLSILCLTVLASCGNKKSIIDSEQIETSSEIIENTEASEVDQSGATSLEEISESNYNVYEGDFSYGTDEKILFFYSANNEDSMKIDENLSKETNITTFSDIFKVDMALYTGLTEQYIITEANTFILIDEEGNLITKINGAANSSDLLKLYD